MKARFLTLLLLVSSLAAGDAAPPDVDGLAVKPDGTFSWNGVGFMVLHATPPWTVAEQKQIAIDAGFPKTGDGHWEITGTLPIPGVTEPLAFSEILDRIDASSFKASYSVHHLQGIPTATLALVATLQVVDAAGKDLLVDGAPLSLPADYGESKLLLKNDVHSLSLPVDGGTLTAEGNFGLLVQDDRAWKAKTFTIRLAFDPTVATLTQARLDLTLRFHAYRTVAIDISGQANRSFRDDPDASIHGWTGQGPNNDLSMLPPGPLTAAGVTFQVIDPAKNEGRACLAFGKDGQDLPHDPVVIPVPGHPVLANLYLLHASAWTPKAPEALGTIVAHYADGSESRAEVQSGRDVGDWWTRASLPNAILGWSGENKSSGIGLYVSRFPLNAKPLESIRLEGSGQGDWMVVSLSGSPDLIPLGQSASDTITAGKDWIPLDYPLDIAPGGIFDFSGLNDAPAGKYGPVAATPDGHFAFRDRPDVPVRFWGVKVCTAAAFPPTHELADRLADRIARSGYNVVRIHHFDRELIPTGAASYDIDMTKIDQLDYLVSALKERGVYVNIDLYTLRSFSAEEEAAFGWPPGTGKKDDGDSRIQWFKVTLPLSDAAFDSWQRYVRALLTHRNPYTGLTWGRDPVLVGICPVNEDTLLHQTLFIRKQPVLTKLYEDKFAAWKADPAHATATSDDSTQAYNHFLSDIQLKNDARMAAFIHSLGVTVPLTGTNCDDWQGQVLQRSRFDYVDDHDYWDMPGFLGAAWKLPLQLQQADPIRAAARMPREIMPSRIFGKPFTVTEYSYVWPNRFRSVGGLLMADYASVQDWDGIYYFAYVGQINELTAPGIAGVLGLAPDPINLLGDRLGAIVFRRGDVKPASRAVCFAVDPDRALSGEKGRWREFPSVFTLLGLTTRIGSLPGAPADILASDTTARQKIAAMAVDAAPNVATDPSRHIYSADAGLAARLAQDGIVPPDDGKRYATESGQVVIDSGEGTLRSVTDASESFFLPASRRLDGNVVSVTNGPEGESTVAVVAADGKPLAQSGRLLILDLTDCVNSNTSFRDQDHHLLNVRGALPHLIRVGSADIILKLPDPDAWQAWAVGLDGTRQAPVPLEKTADGVVLHARTDGPEGARLAYELAHR